MDKYRYILFDIDGVLAHGTDSWKSELAVCGIAEEAFFADWSSSPSVADFEGGKSTPEEFAASRAGELRCGIPPESVIRLLKARKSVLFVGVENLLRELAEKGFKTACLSNTNVIHWNNIERREILDSAFEREFLSFETGLLKPGREAYAFVLDSLGIEPRETLYFDDSPRNVEVATSMGINAERVNGFSELSGKIRTLLNI